MKRSTPSGAFFALESIADGDWDPWLQRLHGTIHLRQRTKEYRATLIVGEGDVDDANLPNADLRGEHDVFCLAPSGVWKSCPWCDVARAARADVRERLRRRVEALPLHRRDRHLIYRSDVLDLIDTDGIDPHERRQ